MFNDFKWKKPRVVPSFIEGGDARLFLREFNERANRYNNPEALKVLSFDSEKGIVVGSNPFAVVLTNEILRTGITTATPRQIEYFLESGLHPSMIHADTALYLTGLDRTNSFVAESLNRQIRERGFKESVLIPLTSLDLFEEKDQLGFKLREDAEIIRTEFLEPGTFSQLNNDGVPIRGKGNRILYANSDSGLKRYRHIGKDISVESGSLLGSSPVGKIIIVKEFN